MRDESVKSRPTATFITLFSFLLATVSGVILFMWPGRGAGPTFEIWGLTHNLWTDLHIVTSLAMVAAALWHVWINRHVIVCYLTRRRTQPQAPKRFRFSPEFAIGLGVGVFLTFASIVSLPPATWLGDLKHEIQTVWSDKGVGVAEGSDATYGRGGGSGRGGGGGFNRGGGGNQWAADH